MVLVTSVSISDLKARLSRYLREVRRGGEVQVLDRGVPVARLTGVGAPGEQPTGRRARLVEAGVVRAGSGGASRILESAPLEIPTDLREALEEGRAERL